MHDENLIALGNEMVDFVVGAKDFLEFLPLDSRESPPSFSKTLIAKLASRKTEAQMYEPFVRIPFSFLYP